MPFIKEEVNFKLVIAKMSPRIPWEPVVDPLGSMEHTFGNTETESLLGEERTNR